MRKLIISTTYLLISMIGFANPEMDSARKAYDEGEYEKALNIYQKLEDDSLQSADLFYNLGNCYYKTKDLGLAILNYEKALYRSPTHEDAQFNLELANEKIVDKFDEIPDLTLDNALAGLERFIPASLISTIGILFVFAGLGVMIYGKFKQLKLRKLSLLFLALGILVSFWSIKQTAAKNKNDYGIILTYKARVLNEPNSRGKELFELHEGTKVQVLNELENWVEIKTPQGAKGWFKSQNIGFIKPK